MPHSMSLELPALQYTVVSLPFIYHIGMAIVRPQNGRKALYTWPSL